MLLPSSLPIWQSDGSGVRVRRAKEITSSHAIQALTLVMATWLRPEVLLLDEHTAALDPKSGDKVIRVSEDVIARDKLTALMVTHSMSQAATLGDRLVMMHRGRIIYDVRGAEKRRLRPADLLARFEEVRRGEQLDETAADMLKRAYV
jgi:putative ABC transport system ATP-binding protein